MYICKICNHELKTLNGLGCHITKKHDIGKQKYYDLYYKIEETEGNCFKCQNSTRFVDIEKGYKKFCSQQCANSINNPTNVRDSILNRSEEEKKKTKQLMEKYWNNGDNRLVHGKKMTKQLLENSESISKKRVATMKKWSPKRLKDYKEKLRNSWKIKSENDLKIKYEKQYVTNIKSGTWIPKELKTEFERYASLVKNETKLHISDLFNRWSGLDYYDNIKLITNEEYNKLYPDLHLNTNMLQPTIDHIISVHRGFLDGIDYKLIGNIDNLCLCSRLNNSIKSEKDQKYLREKIGNKNES